MEFNLKNIKTESDNFEYSGQTITSPTSSQTISTKPTSVFSIENLLKDNNKKLYSNTSNFCYRHEKNPTQYENYRQHYYKPLVETSSNHEADSSSSYPIIEDEEIISSDDDDEFDEQLGGPSLNDSGSEIKNSDEVVSTSNDDFSREQKNYNNFNPGKLIF